MNFCRFLDCFLATSWHILGCSWWFLKTSSWFVTTFSPPELSSLLKIHQEATETPSRSQWDANKTTTISSRSDKICQIVKKWQDLSNRHEYFWNFQKTSWSFPIYQELSGNVRKCQEVSRSCSRSLQEDIRKCQDLKFCTIRVVIRDSGTALFGQPEIHQIINTNLTRIKGNNIRGKKKMYNFWKPHAYNLIRFQLN